jgi:hypothetical protein
MGRIELAEDGYSEHSNEFSASLEADTFLAS